MRQILLALLLLTTSVAHAGDDAPRKDASAHFGRGVELYNDGDFRGALVEFKKAYAIWPRANVLYDVGQCEFQLLDYASSLKTMERYLAETGPNALHRSEVEATVEILRNRVGRIALATSVPECDVTIDDQPAGTTPIASPILVSVGSRKLVLHCPGRAPTTRQVEVAAGETVRLDPKLPTPSGGALSLRTASTPTPSDAPKLTTRTSLAIGWSFSALLVAATIGVGSSALVEQGHLQQMRGTFPVMKDQLDRQGNLTLGLSIAADALAVAGLVAIGVSTYLTVKFAKEQKPHKVRIGMTGAGVFASTTF
jgi:tetratricopeptide (TPR) repeat protein